MQQIKIDSKYTDKTKDIIIVEVGGYVDQSNSHQLQKMFNDVLESGVFKVIVDFSQLYYMSSAGWGIFVGEVKRFRDHGGDIRLAAMNPDIYDVYQMLEFYHILEDYVSVDEAAESFGDDRAILDLVQDEPEKEDDEPDNKKSSESVGEIFVPGYKRRHDEETQEIDIEQTPSSGSRKPETSSPSKEKIDMTPAEGSESEAAPPEVDFTPQKMERTIKLAQLPLQEKIRRVVAENPLLGLWGIRRVLRHEHFGHVKIGRFRLWRLLKQLDLDTRAKRYRYYRSC